MSLKYAYQRIKRINTLIKSIHYKMRMWRLYSYTYYNINFIHIKFYVCKFAITHILGRKLVRFTTISSKQKKIPIKTGGFYNDIVRLLYRAGIIAIIFERLCNYIR